MKIELDVLEIRQVWKADTNQSSNVLVVDLGGERLSIPLSDSAAVAVARKVTEARQMPPPPETDLEDLPFRDDLDDVMPFEAAPQPNGLERLRQRAQGPAQASPPPPQARLAPVPVGRTPEPQPTDDDPFPPG